MLFTRALNYALPPISIFPSLIQRATTGISRSADHIHLHPDHPHRKNTVPLRKEQIRTITERLTQSGVKREITENEKKRDPTLRYTLYDDAKECTFRPKINSAPGGKKKGKRGGKGGEEKDGSGEDAEEANRKQEAESRDAFGFLDRQEAMEREKRYAKNTRETTNQIHPKLTHPYLPPPPSS